MYKLSAGLTVRFSSLVSPACVQAGFKLCISVFLMNVFIPGARQLLARKRKVRCSVKCVFTTTAGCPSVVATGQVRSHVPLLAWYTGALKCVKSCAVLGFLSDTEFPTCGKWKIPRWRRKDLKKKSFLVQILFLSACLSAFAVGNLKHYLLWRTSCPERPTDEQDRKGDPSGRSPLPACFSNI